MIDLTLYPVAHPVQPPVIIRRVAEQYGWLSNMSPHQLTWDGKTYCTAEAYFQSARFPVESAARDLICAQKSPMRAKMAAKGWAAQRVVAPMSRVDCENMKATLRLKLRDHPHLRGLLDATGDRVIVEDCTSRQTVSGLFWGAARRGDTWVGYNTLGQLWMEIRAEERAHAGEDTSRQTCTDCGAEYAGEDRDTFFPEFNGARTVLCIRCVAEAAAAVLPRDEELDVVDFHDTRLYLDPEALRDDTRGERDVDGLQPIQVVLLPDGIDRAKALGRLMRAWTRWDAFCSPDVDVD